MTPRITALLTVLVLLLGAAPAAAQQDPFGPIPQSPQPSEPAPAPDDSGDEDDGALSGLESALIGLAAAGLIAGLAWFILRDAKRRAPVDEEHPMAESFAGKHPGSRAPKAKRKQQSRARARQARQARKRAR